MEVVLVRLNDTGRISYFDKNNIDIMDDALVIVKLEKRLEFGRVEKILMYQKNTKEILEGKILRIVNDDDLKQITKNEIDSNKALKKCIELVKKENLNMRMIDAHYTFDRQQLIFRFLSEERVDFRQLAKELGSIFKTRIELRQVGIRDKAKIIGGIGPCGRKLCCLSFLNEFESVSINMAKNQNLSLNPSKINGVCGRLLCCLKYENSNYTEYKKGLPNINSKIKIAEGEGKVISIDVFNRKYKVLLNDSSEIIEVSAEDDSKK